MAPRINFTDVLKVPVFLRAIMKVPLFALFKLVTLRYNWSDNPSVHLSTFLGV